MNQQKLIKFIQESSIPEVDKTIWIKHLEQAKDFNSTAKLIRDYLNQRVDELTKKAGIDLHQNQQYQKLAQQTSQQLQVLQKQFGQTISEYEHKLLQSQKQAQTDIDNMELEQVEKEI